MSDQPNGVAWPLLEFLDSPETKPPLNEQWQARRRVSAAAQELLEHLVTTDADANSLNALSEVLEQQSGQLAIIPKLAGRDAMEASTKHGSLAYQRYELNALDGLSHPMAFDMKMWVDNDRLYGKAKMGWRFEGPNNCVHGGYVAALFDQLLGNGQKLTGQPGFTGTLSVKYLATTPLHTELDLECWVDRVEGRKNFLKGEIRVGETVTAVSEGVFIYVQRD